MAFQPINFLNMPLLKSPLDQDFGALIQKGMELRHEPERLMRLKQQQELGNKLGQEKLNQAMVESEFQRPMLEQKQRGLQQTNDLQIPMAEAKMRSLEQQALFNELKRRLYPQEVQSNIDYKRSLAQQMQGPKSDLGKTLKDYQDIVNKKGVGSPEAIAFKNALDAKVANAQNKNMTAQEKEEAYLGNLYDTISDPNVPQKDRERAQAQATREESKMIIKANGQQTANRLASGIPMQKSIKKLIEQPYLGIDKKTGKATYDHSPLWYLTLYSGVDGAARYIKDKATRSPNIAKHKAALSLAHTANDQFGAYNSLSVQPKSVKQREKIFNPSNPITSQRDAYDAALDGLKTLTMEHQGSLDEARLNAGLPLQRLDVMGKPRAIPQEEIERHASGRNYGLNINVPGPKGLTVTPDWEFE